MIRSRWRLWLALGVSVLLVAAYALSPGLRSALNTATTVLAEADIEGARTYLLSFGIWAPIVSALLMVLQALLLPLPSVILTVTNGLLFGALWGTVLSWSSGMLAAMVCYWLARALGRPVVTRLAGAAQLEQVDRFFARYGNRAVLLGRLIPVISFDVVSYAAGLTALSPGRFALATGIGQLPATILYSILGENMPEIASAGLWAVLGLAVIVMAGMALRASYQGKLQQDSPMDKE